MKISTLLFAISISIITTCAPNQKQEIPINKSPEWAKNAIWYQIFVERFNNGDMNNDPSPTTIFSNANFNAVPENWKITPWTQNWYKQEDWTIGLKGDFYSALQLRRYGGDLKGVLDKIEYLKELGITAIYFNPLNDAPSLHKYDARNYHHIDICFGPDPKGDLEKMALEDPNDPATWVWTSADSLFLSLVKEFHKNGIKVVVDFSWNHTGTDFWAWQDILKNQAKSPYKDWYNIDTFDDPSTPENEFNYHGWLNLSSLPELRKVGTDGTRKFGHPYEGNLNEGAKKHIFEVTKRWLAPDGDTKNGIDGFRLDVADHIPMVFWRDYRKFVRGINSEAYLVGEIWWEEWPNRLMNPVPYTSGDVFDAVMFYQIYKSQRLFFSKNEHSISSEKLVDSLNFQWNRLQGDTKFVNMNTAATHDTPRLLTSFYNSNKYKYNAKPNDDPNYKTGLPDNETYQRVRLFLIHQFTAIGAPQIWNGDEMGMWGADDPDCRKPLMWKEYSFENETTFPTLKQSISFPVQFNTQHFEFYKKIIALRKNNPVLSHGNITFITAKGGYLHYSRTVESKTLFVAFNLGTESIAIQTNGNISVLLQEGNTEIKGKQIKLSPLSAMVYE